MSDFYKLEIDEVIQKLDGSLKSGLDGADAAGRISTYGYNELLERGVKSPWKIMLEQFSETLVVVLMISAVISAVLQDYKDALAILVIVLVNGLLGFRQEYQAEKAMAALKKLAVPKVRVRRSNHIEEISSRDLVPGDLIFLEAGNMAPADARLVESANLRVQEAALTGESEPVSKDILALPGKDLALAERHNMIYMGTVITYGRGQAVVSATGMHTELGKIAELMQASPQEPTPLQKRLNRLGKQLAMMALGLVVVVIILGLFRKEELDIILLTGISMAVAVVPEGLPAVVTIALALGARRMLARRALIRKLPAVEALGSVTVICSDKTGTLTENRMTVTVVDVAEHRIDLVDEFDRKSLSSAVLPCQQSAPTPEQASIMNSHPVMSLLLAGGALCNDAVLECEEQDPLRYHIVGDPTEGALVVAAARLGLNKEALEKIFPRKAELPFDSDRKRMTTIHEYSSQAKEQWVDDVLRELNLSLEPVKYIAFTKGAMDGLLKVSSRVWVQNHVQDISPEWINRIDAANASLAKSGMRVLGVACRLLDSCPSGEQLENIENDLIFIGLVGMIDPARVEVKQAVETCRTAGIRPMMITGDHPLTAKYIANELGIDTQANVLTGSDLDSLNDTELQSVVEKTSVYARVSPEHKLKIVHSLQKSGHIAAMTGDGVNDAPALRQADIGVAMGITGTDVSKEASDIVLLDDNFATIVAAVEEGRIIYDNIRKFIQYTMTSNTGEIWVMLLGPFLGMPLALLPLQILWINLVTDGLPGLALGVEKGERNIMQRPPYPPNEGVFSRGLGVNILFIGFLMGILSLGVGYTYWRMDQPTWQTMVFTTLTLSEMGYVMAIRSNRDSLFSIGVFSNRSMIGAVLLTTGLQIAVVYVPALQDILHTVSLPLRDLGVALLLSMSLFVVVEIQKWIIRKRRQ